MRTKNPRDLADAPEASEYNHVDEPAKSLFKPYAKLPDQVLHTKAPLFVLPSHQRNGNKYVSRDVLRFAAFHRDLSGHFRT